MADLLTLPAFADAASPAAGPGRAETVSSLLTRAPVPPGARLADWLVTQAAVVEHWLDRLIAEGGDPRLIGVLEQHAAFLKEAAAV